MHIIQLTKTEAHQLLTQLQDAKEHGPSGLWSLRVAQEGDSVKFKINEFTWSPPMGELDPMCEEALRRRELAK